MADPIPPLAVPVSFAVPANAPSSGALSLEDGARVIGHHVWLEMRLFEILGRWVASVPELDVKAHMATHSRHHGWHGELWHGHLPRVAGIDADALVGPPNDGAAAALGALAESTSTVERLACLYRVVLPRVVTATARRLATASPVADAALARSLRFVLADDLEEWRSGEARLESLLSGPDDVDRATARQAEVEKLVVVAGGLTGDFTGRT